MPSIAITCPPATFLTGSQLQAGTGTIDRAARRVGLLGTLDGSYIVLIPTGTYVWFATTSSLGITGIDPSTHTSNLGTGYRVLISGTRTPTEVAEHLRYAASVIPNFSSSRIGTITTISSSNLVPASCHTGITWTQRGFADIKGARQPYLDNSGPVNNLISQPMPWSGSNGRLRFMRIGRAASGGTYRAAIYFSPTGTSTTSPNGSATLLYDFGLTPGNITNGYEYVFPSGTCPTIPSTGTIWLTVKDNNTHGDIRVLSGGNQDENNTDFFNQNFFQSDNTGFDPTVAYPYNWVEDGSLNVAVRLDLAMGVDFPPFAGAGDLEFKFGSHVSATFDVEVSTAITGTLAMRQIAPLINGLRVVSSTISVGDTHVEQYRGGIIISGTISNPHGAIIYDIPNLTTGSAINEFHTVAPTGSIPITSGTIFGPIWKQNDGGSELLFTFGNNPDPPYEPSDWHEGSEYETFASGQMNRDETVAYESTFTTGSTDLRPGNFPRFHVILRVDGFQLAQGGDDPPVPQTNSARSFFIFG